jgi:hypothetical protein
MRDARVVVVIVILERVVVRDVAKRRVFRVHRARECGVSRARFQKINPLEAPSDADARRLVVVDVLAHRV